MTSSKIISKNGGSEVLHYNAVVLEKKILLLF